MNSNPLTGAYYFLTGFNLIFKPGVRCWVFIPLLISILLFSGLLYYGLLQYQLITHFITTQIETWLPDWQWLTTLIAPIQWLITPLFFTTALIIIFFAYTLIATAITKPFNGWLAQAVERHLRGKVTYPPFSLLNFIFYFIWSKIAKIIYYLFWAIILLIISFIPLINLISPLLWFLFGAWLISLEYMEAPMSNHGYKGKAQRRMLAQKRLMALGFGSTVLIIMLIPFINFLVLPVAVAGATRFWVGEFANKVPPPTS
jgi:CysZ protein